MPRRSAVLILFVSCISIIGTVHVDSLAQEEQQKETALTELIKALGSGDFYEREAAEEKLLQIGKLAAEELLKAANDPDPEIRYRVLRILADLDAKGIVNAEEVFKDKAGYYITKAIRAIQEGKDADALAFIRKEIDKATSSPGGLFQTACEIAIREIWQMKPGDKDALELW